MHIKKDREREILRPFALVANCVRPRVFTERPYENDFLSAGINLLYGRHPLASAFVSYTKKLYVFVSFFAFFIDF